MTALAGESFANILQTSPGITDPIVTKQQSDFFYTSTWQPRARSFKGGGASNGLKLEGWSVVIS